MSAKRLFSSKKDDSYFMKLTNDTVLLGENLFKKITDTFKKKKSFLLNEKARRHRQNRKNLEENSISSCSESLPFYCKSEIIHSEDVFTSRNGHSCAIHNNIAYIYGGINEINPPKADLITYDFDSHMFKTIEEKNKLKPRYFASLDIFYSSELNEYCLFLFGGKNGNYITNDTYIFVISKSFWKILETPYYPPPLFGHVSFRFKNVIFIHGGNMGNSRLNTDMWCFFEAEKKWVKVLSKEEFYEYDVKKPTDRYFHSCSINVSRCGNDVKAYIFGGLDNTHKCVEDLFWCYSLNNGNWMSLENYTGESPMKRYGHGSMIINNRWLIVYGGCNLTWYRKSILKDMYAYDINLNNWSYISVYGMTPMIHQFYGNIVQIDESGYFYIFGGIRDDETCCNVYKYSPLFTSQYFSFLHEKIQALAEKIEFLQKNKNLILNYSFRTQLNEISEISNRISYTFAKYLQVVDDLNEKIRISNSMAITNYGQMLKKFENNNIEYNNLLAKVKELEKAPYYSLFSIAGEIKNDMSSNESIIKELDSLSLGKMDYILSSTSVNGKSSKGTSESSEKDGSEYKEKKRLRKKKTMDKKKRERKNKENREVRHIPQTTKSRQTDELEIINEKEKYVENDNEKERAMKKEKEGERAMKKEKEGERAMKKEKDGEKAMKKEKEREKAKEKEKEKRNYEKSEQNRINSTTNITRNSKSFNALSVDHISFAPDYSKISYASKISKMTETQKNTITGKADVQKREKKKKNKERSPRGKTEVSPLHLFKKLNMEQDKKSEDMLRYLDK